MFKAAFENFDLLELPLISMFIFMTVFLVGSIRAFLRKRENEDELAALPLGEEEVIIASKGGIS